LAIAQGSSERNITFVVVDRSQCGGRARNPTAFQLARSAARSSPQRPRTDWLLLGFGHVGRALAALAACDGHAGSGGGGCSTGPDTSSTRGGSPIAPAQAGVGKDAAPRRKPGGVRANADAAGHIASHRGERPVVVDVTAEETGDLLLKAAAGSTSCSATRTPLAALRGILAVLRRAALGRAALRGHVGRDADPQTLTASS